MNYTIIPILHGVQAFSLDKETVRDFIAGVRAYVPDQFKDWIKFQIIDWDDIVGQRQLEAFEMEKGLPKQRLLKLKHTVGSDLLWDVQTRNLNGDQNIYNQIVSFVTLQIGELKKVYGNTSNLVLIGHSWGGQRALSYCFDSPFNVHGLITMGSPITAVSGRFPDWGKLPTDLKFWLNFRMAGDWIGSQFKYHKSQQFREFVEDIHLSSWNPLNWFTIKAHTYYWKSKEVHKRIAEKIIREFYT